MIHEFKLSCRLGPNHQHRLKHEYSEISNTSAIMYCLIQRTYQYLILPKLINCGARKNGNLRRALGYINNGLLTHLVHIVESFYHGW
jgi:DNA-binding HxlR family transcriptional regulator